MLGVKLRFSEGLESQLSNPVAPPFLYSRIDTCGSWLADGVSRRNSGVKLLKMRGRKQLAVYISCCY